MAKTSLKVMATGMGYARRPVSLATLILIVALITFVVGGGLFVVANLTATTSTTKPGRITVDILDIHQLPTAAANK